MSKIQFRKVQYSNVFGEQFNPWENNNVIDFKEKKIAVIYGPNGTGKTSFIHALENQTDSELLYDYDGDEYKNGSDVFHIIKDQNDRNIIEGNTQDFLLGDNIRREVELAKSIDQNREKLRNELIEILKEFNISKKESPLLELVKDDIIKNFLKALANTRDKGKLYTNEAFIAVLVKILECPKEDNIVGFDSLKLNFLAKDYIDKNSILQKLEKLNHDNLG